MKFRRQCSYCHKVGHTTADCYSMKRKQTRQDVVSQSWAVVLLKTMSSCLTPTFSDLADDTEDCFKPFVFEGFVSLMGKVDDQHFVKILHNTSMWHIHTCEIFKGHGIESFKYVREFYTRVCCCGDISMPRNMTMNETKRKLWLVVGHVGQWKLPWIPDLQPEDLVTQDFICLNILLKFPCSLTNNNHNFTTTTKKKWFL